MNFIESWWRNKFQKRDDARIRQLGMSTFNTVSGQELLQAYMDEILMCPPNSTDPYVICDWKARCSMVTDIIKALDAANDPAKYQQPPRNVRPIIGGRVNG